MKKSETIVRYQARSNSGNDIILESDTPFAVICDLCSESGLSYKDFAEGDITIYKVTREVYKYQGEVAYINETFDKLVKISSYTEVFNLITFVGI